MLNFCDKVKPPNVSLSGSFKSKIKPGAALITMGGGYFSAGTDNLKRLLENLPKKLYYSNSQPSSFDWNDKAIIKL